MNIERCHGIVLRETPYGEDSKLLTLFSDVHGRVTVFVRGAKKPTSRYVAASQLFSYSEWELAKGRNMYNASHVRLVDSFYGLRQDWDVLILAGALVKLILRVIQEDQEDRETLRLLLNTLHFLERGEKDPRLLASLFRIRLLGMQGWIPDVTDCTTPEDLQRILGLSLPALSPETVAVVRFFCQAPMEQLFRLRLGEQITTELEQLSLRLTEHFIEGV